MRGQPPRKDREQIVDALKRGEKYAWIEAEFKVSQMSISRYRRQFNLPNRYQNRKDASTKHP